MCARWGAATLGRRTQDACWASGDLLVYHPLLVGIVSGVALTLYLTTRKRSVAGAIALLITPPLAWFLGGGIAEISALLALVILMLWAFRRHLHTILQPKTA
jgi:hypothetical protein